MNIYDGLFMVISRLCLQTRLFPSCFPQVMHVRCPSMLTFYEDIYISELRDELSKVRRLWAKGPWGVDPHLREQTWTTNDCRCW